MCEVHYYRRDKCVGLNSAAFSFDKRLIVQCSLSIRPTCTTSAQTPFWFKIVICSTHAQSRAQSSQSRVSNGTV